jgi:cytochrome P450
MNLCASIPRHIDLDALRADPLAHLQSARSAAANGLVVVSESGPVFSRAYDCSAAVAVFGPQGAQQVLTDPDLFGTSVSVGELFALPPTLVRLNAGLFSMRGEQHKSHQQLLRAVTAVDQDHDFAVAVARGWKRFAAQLPSERDVELLAEMHRLTLHVSEQVVFGDADVALGTLAQSYFDYRRLLSGRHVPPGTAERRALIAMGGQLDRMLRKRLAALRREHAASDAPPASLFGRLATLPSSGDVRLTDDQLIAHANMLFLSASEPIAVTLTWVLLLLSQQPALRLALRRELAAVCGSRGITGHADDADCPLLKAVIQETLRLLPPNAIMVRLTTSSASLLGHTLPPQCEIILSPFVAHRDPQEFSGPDLFDPQRWSGFRPPAYSYFPFSMGARHCIGRQLANVVLLSLLARILVRYDVVLARDQELDWKINITLMPAAEPVVRFVAADANRTAQIGGRLGGPVAALVRFAASDPRV